VFQFLIGSLEAEKEDKETTSRRFQFLIGSLEAGGSGLYESSLLEFQFLIGSLEAKPMKTATMLAATRFNSS